MEEAIGKIVVESALRVHSALGPGLLESAYEACLAYDLERHGIEVARQLNMPVAYEDVKLDVGYRLDMLIGQKVVMELKAVERILPLHQAQLLSYLKLGGYKLGFLLNFNCVHMRDGIKRLVNGL
jgi:GxxExxY protein